jgi:hypothetical protein
MSKADELAARADEIKARKETAKDMKDHPENYFTNPAGHIRDRIMLHENEKLPKDGIFMSLNGYSFLAKPNVEIDLPRPVREMLDTRTETQTIKGDDGKVYTRNIKRFPYQVIQLDVKPEGLPVAKEEPF